MIHIPPRVFLVPLVSWTQSLSAPGLPRADVVRGATGMGGSLSEKTLFLQKQKDTFRLEDDFGKFPSLFFFGSHFFFFGGGGRGVFGKILEDKLLHALVGHFFWVSSVKKPTWATHLLAERLWKFRPFGRLGEPWGSWTFMSKQEDAFGIEEAYRVISSVDEWNCGNNGGALPPVDCHILVKLNCDRKHEFSPQMVVW